MGGGHLYAVLHKPVGCLSSRVDSADLGRDTVYTHVEAAGLPSSLGHVGRLDFETSGLLLFTSDPHFNSAVRNGARASTDGGAGEEEEDPSGRVSKTYRLVLAGRYTYYSPPLELMRAALCYEGGGRLSEGQGGEEGGSRMTRPAQVRVIRSWVLADQPDPKQAASDPLLSAAWLPPGGWSPLGAAPEEDGDGEGEGGGGVEREEGEAQGEGEGVGGVCHPAPFGGWLTEVEVTLQEGKNRQVRRLCTRSRVKLRRLHRVAVGGLEVGDMPEGSMRELTEAEVASVLAEARSLAGTGPGHKHTLETPDKTEGAPKHRRSSSDS